MIPILIGMAKVFAITAGSTYVGLHAGEKATDFVKGQLRKRKKVEAKQPRRKQTKSRRRKAAPQELAAISA